MNGFIKVIVLSGGVRCECWQNIVDGVVVGYVDASGADKLLPKIREEHVATGELLAAPQ